jgi:hypothetical protein
MSTRKSFLGAAASLGAVMAAARGASAAPTSSPKPAPTATPVKPPSEAARAVALRMRSFDEKLTDAEIDNIAHGIDDSWSVGSRLNARGKALSNSDEPDPAFSVRA